MSRSKTNSSFRASFHRAMARCVRGLEHNPRIILSRPASIRFAISISPSRDSNSTEPISRRYIRTGSSVRPRSSSPVFFELAAVFFSFFTDTSPSSESSSSTTLIPSSLSRDIVSSICSEDTSSGGKAEFKSS